MPIRRPLCGLRSSQSCGVCVQSMPQRSREAPNLRCRATDLHTRLLRLRRSLTPSPRCPTARWSPVTTTATAAAFSGYFLRSWPTFRVMAEHTRLTEPSAMAAMACHSCFADHFFVLSVYVLTQHVGALYHQPIGSIALKITAVEAIHLRAEDPLIELFDGSYDDCVLVVHTDSELIGIGETESMAPAIQAIVRGPSAHNHARSLSSVLVGADPTDPVELWHRMYESTDYVGRRGLVMHAIGGVDLALWDLRGKIEGKPVHALLGGARRDRLPAYGTIYPMARAPEEVRAQAVSGQAKNLRNFKFAADPWWLDDIALTGRLLAAAREQAGDRANLIIDAALSY